MPSIIDDARQWWYTLRERATTLLRGFTTPAHHHHDRAGGSYGGASSRRPVGFKRLVKLWRYLRTRRLRSLMIFGVRKTFDRTDLGSVWPYMKRPQALLNMSHRELRDPEAVIVTAHHEQVHLDQRSTLHGPKFVRGLRGRFPGAPRLKGLTPRVQIDAIEHWGMGYIRVEFRSLPDPKAKRIRWGRAARPAPTVGETREETLTSILKPGG